MKYTEELKNTPRWYISHEILYFECEQDFNAKEITVWENLILIWATNPVDAYEKAIKRGKENEQEILINGKKGLIKFKGLKDLVLVYDDLEDGAELEWRELQLKKEQVETLTKSKADLHAFNPVDFSRFS